MATEVKLKLSIEGGRIVSQEIDGVTYSFGNMRSASISTSASLADMGSQALALTKTFAGLAAIQKGVTAASDYAGLASRMKLLTGSAEQAAVAMQSVQDIAMRQGANLQAVGDSYAKIGQAMKQMGGTSVDTARMVETVAGALRLGNASTQEAESAMRQFGQAMAKGKLNGDEFVSLMENAPYLMDAVAASLGKTKGDLFAMAEAGQLTAQVFGDAVLGSFDAVTNKADTLAPTIGQAMERIASAFTVAAAESSTIGMVSSAAFAAMGFAAEHAGGIINALTTGALVAMTSQVLRGTTALAGHVSASMAERAAMAASLQTTVASAEAKAIYTGMVLKEAQATLASATGLGASVVAQNAVIAASRAHTAATVVQTEAQMALNAATSLGARALGLLGGPIGLITTALTLGLGAWSLWGSSAKDAEEKATAAVQRSTASIVADLDNQIKRLEQRNALANAKITGNGFDLNSPAAERLGVLQIQLNALEKQTGISTEQRLTQKNKLLAEQGQLQQKLLELEQKNAPERAANAIKAHTEAMAKYAPQVDKATAAIEAERKALGAAFTPADEAKIRAHFAARKDGAAKVSEAQKLVNAGLALYNDLLAEESGYSKTFTEDVTKLAGAYQASGMTAGQYASALDKILAGQPGAIKAAKDQEDAIKGANAAVKAGLDDLAKANAIESARITGLRDAQKAVADYAKSAQESADALEYETGLIGLNIDERKRLMDSYKDEIELKKKIAEIEADTRYNGDETGAREKAIAAVRVASAKATATASGQAALAEWNKTYDRISDGLTDALMTGGKEGAQQVRDLLVQELFSKPFQMVVQALIQPVAQGLTNAAMGAVGEATGMGSLLNGASSAQSMYSMGSKAWGWLTGGGASAGMPAVATAAEGFMTSLNMATVASEGFATGLGSGGFMIAEEAASLTSAFVTATPAVEAIGGAAIAAEGGLIAGAEGMLAAIPGWGWAAAAALAVLGGSGLFDGEGGPKTESTYGYAASFGDTSRTGGAGQYVDSIEASWDKIATTLGLTDDLIATAGYSIDKIGKDLTNFNAAAKLSGVEISNRITRTGSVDAAQVGRSDEELQAAMAQEVAYILFNALKASGIGEQAKAYLTEVDASLTAMASEADRTQAMGIAMDNIVIIHDFQAALENLPFAELTGLSFNAAKALITAAGGLDKLSANMGGFYANFYSDAEKQALATQNIGQAFTNLGLVMPAVDEGLKNNYRTMVEGLMAAEKADPSEVNARALAGALALQGGINNLADGFDNAAQAAADAAEKLAQATAQSVASAQDLQVLLGTQTTRGLAQVAAQTAWDTFKQAIPEAANSTEAQIAAFAANPINQNPATSILTQTQIEAMNDFVSASIAWQTEIKPEAVTATATATAAVPDTSYADALAAIAKDTAGFVRQLADVGKEPYALALSNITQAAKDKTAELAKLGTLSEADKSAITKWEKAQVDLLDVTTAFAALTTAKATLEGLVNTGKGLEVARAEALGDTAGAAALQRAIDLEDTLTASLAATARLSVAGITEQEKAILQNTIAVNAATIAKYDENKAYEAATAAITKATNSYQTLRDTFAAPLTVTEATAKVSAAGYDVTGLDSKSIAAYVNAALAGLDPNEAADSAAISILEKLIPSLQLLGETADASAALIKETADASAALIKEISDQTSQAIATYGMTGLEKTLYGIKQQAAAWVKQFSEDGTPITTTEQAAVDTATATATQQALADAGKAATEILKGVNTELANMGKTDLEIELATITQRGADLKKELADFGDVSAASAAAVDNLTAAQTQAAIAADQAAQAITNAKNAFSQFGEGFDIRSNLLPLANTLEILGTAGKDALTNLQGATFALSQLFTANAINTAFASAAANTLGALAQSTTALGDAMQKVNIAAYFDDLAVSLGTFADGMTTLNQALAAGGQSWLSKYPDAELSNVSAIGSAAGQIGSAITASLLADIPAAIKNDPAFAALADPIKNTLLATIGSIDKGDLQGVNDSFILLSNSMLKGDISAAQYSAAIGYVTDRFTNGADALSVVDGLRDEAYQLHLDAQNAVTDAQKEYANVLRDTITSMQDFLSTLDGAASPGESITTARSKFAALSGRAAAGDTSVYDQLTPAAKTFLDLSKNYSASIQDYRRDEAKVRSVLSAVVSVNQNELAKLPAEIAASVDPTKEAWTALQEATTKEHDARVLLTAMAVDEAASKLRLRTAEETLSERYLAAIATMPDGAALAEMFATTIAGDVTDATPDMGDAFSLGDIWGSEIGDYLVDNIPTVTNADLNGIIAEEFPGLVPSDFVTGLTTKQLTDLVSGKFPEVLIEDLVTTKADVKELVNAGITRVLPDGFAGPAFDAGGIWHTAVNKVLASITPAAPVTPSVVTPVTSPVVAPVTPNTTNPDYVTPEGVLANAAAWLTRSAESYIDNGLHLADLRVGFYQAHRSNDQTFFENAWAKTGLPAFATGTNYVPQDMVAQIHEGEAVIPAAFNPERYYKASGNDVLVAEIRGLREDNKALREEVKALRDANSAENNAIANNTRKQQQTLQKWDIDGQPAVRT